MNNKKRRFWRTLTNRKLYALTALLLVALMAGFIPTTATPFEWQLLSGPQAFVGGPGIIPWSENNLSLFGRNQQNGDLLGRVITRANPNAQWVEDTDWFPMEFLNNIASDVDCALVGERGHCVGLSSNNQMVHFTCHTGPCVDNFVSGDRQIITKPTIVPSSQNSYRVYAVDSEGNFVSRVGSYIEDDGVASWGDWTVIIGAADAILGEGSNPDCVRTDTFDVHCFVVGLQDAEGDEQDNLLHTFISVTEGWSGVWNNLGGLLHSGISAVSVNDGEQIHVFVEGPPDGFTPVTQLWRRVSRNDGQTWGAWEALGGDVLGTPACVQIAQFRIHCLVHGPFDAMWFNSFPAF